jgi:hypothetical protein
MRHPVRLLVVVALAAAATTAAQAAAATPRTVAVAPKVIAFGEVQHITGRGWPVIEFCERTVRIRLRSAQNGFKLGTAHLRASGRFSFSWTPRRAEVGAGRWRVVALQRCESGKDGSRHFLRRSQAIRITRHHGLHG